MLPRSSKHLPAFLSLMIISQGLSAAPVDAPAFFDTLQATYQKEYVECTGDQGPQSIKYLVAWKDRLAEWTKSKDFAEQLADFKKCVDPSGAITPCKLRDWAARHKAEQDAKEHAVVNYVLENNDSIEAIESLGRNPASAFDFPGIPFGVSRNIFSYLFKRGHTGRLEAKDAFFYVTDMPWGAGAYLTAFYFNKNDVFYKYEIETPGRPGDSLNTAVRPAASELISLFEQKLGPAGREYRVGYFDIKSKELSPLKKWDDADHVALIGLSAFKYRYYAKVVVANTRLSQEKAAPEK
jgi:hypothetical protein